MDKKYKKIAYSFVMADLLHYGHIKLLKTARKSADYHICGVISDETCHLWQGVNICNYEERKAVLESLKYVDEVVKQDSMDPTENIMAIRDAHPHAKIIVVHGDDWKTIPGRDYIESIGAQIVQPEYYAQLSRDAIIKKFRHSTPHHPLKHEYFTRDFSVGNIVQFSPQGASKLISTKANTLKNFQSILKLSRIEKLFICSVGDFQTYKIDILKSIKKQFKGKVIVRSSCFSEDGYNVSNAGYFESVNDVDSQDTDNLANALSTVMQSYEKACFDNPKNELLVQSQTIDTVKSGVIFTRNLGSNTPYYMINFDDETGKTDTVTGGDESKCTWLYKDGNISRYPKKWQKIMAVIREIENELPGMILDIEFGEKRDGTIIIYQIRPLAANVRCEEFNDDSFNALIKENILKYMTHPEKITNSKSFLSDMAFWNPSEIIGDDPHPLDYSVYSEIITKSAWNRGLSYLGYSRVKYDLMEKYGNKPYINLDYSFYALTPDALNSGLKQKLVAYYKRMLKKDLTAHDKIEFEIVLSCYDFETEIKLAKLRKSRFSESEIKEIAGSLKSVSLSIVKNYRKTLKKFLSDLRKLQLKTESITGGPNKQKDHVAYIHNFLELLNLICRYGTPQFSAIARMAFMSKSFCRSLVNRGYYSESEMNAFLESISTVATEFNVDSQKYISGDLDRKTFFGKYGHLRAGTYDIRARRYDQMDFSDRSINDKDFLSTGDNTRKSLDRGRLERALKESVYSDISPEDFLFFLVSSIEQREFFKFEFTRSLSQAFECLVLAGETLGLSREQLSYLDLAVIKSAGFYSEQYDLKTAWKAWIEKNRSIHSENLMLVLPPVIQSEIDFEVINLEAARPNFISQHRVIGEVVTLDSDTAVDISGKIVLLTKADPGFDWIFTKNIKGLITKYGGAASHMAIRSAEFNIPAAIGCGEQIYKKVSQWEKLEIDCKAKKIRPILDYNA